jgi:hypothetical protein
MYRFLFNEGVPSLRWSTKCEVPLLTSLQRRYWEYELDLECKLLVENSPFFLKKKGDQCLVLELHPLFYPSGVKIIPKNIYDLLTPVALAHLVMGDGSKERHGLIICTDSYSIEDVVRLIKTSEWGWIKCTIKVRNQDKYRIYIREGSTSPRDYKTARLRDVFKYVI